MSKSPKTPAKQTDCATSKETQLNTIAERINAREGEIKWLIRSGLNLAALIGQDLSEVRGLLPHGQWLSWVEENCSFSRQQAHRYIKIFVNYPQYIEQDQCPANLSINACLELINAPDDVKELVADAVADGEVVEQRTIRELCGKKSYPDNRFVSSDAETRGVEPLNATIEPVKPQTEVKVGQDNVAPIIKPEFWKFSCHACRFCFGRILTRRVAPRIEEFICCECETRVRGTVEDLCWCGKHIVGEGRGRMFECIENPTRGPQLPNRVMVREKRLAIQKIEPRARHEVYIDDREFCA